MIKATPTRALVTGGAGFLGSHLCERLLDQGCQVICMDNLSTGSLSNIEGLKARAGFEFREHDVTRPFEANVEVIYNLACPASPVHYQRDAVQTLKTCVYGAENVLALARKHNARVLQASTSEVYGDPLEHPQREHYWGHVNPCGVRSCYDEGKRAAEALFMDYRRQHGVSVRIVRIFNTYGPRMHEADGRVVSNFIIQALRNEPISLYGQGGQTRAFCYVDDLVDGLIALMACADDNLGPVNIGNPAEITIRELAERVIRLTGSRSQMHYLPLPADDPKRRCPDIGLARATLGWEPTRMLEEGLTRTIEYFRRVLEK